MDSIPQNVEFWPMALYCAACVGVVSGMLGLSYLLGQRNTARTNTDPYESGIVSTGTARVRVSADFYQIAMLFVVFDLESVYVLTWASAALDLGWTGYAVICVFLGSVLAAFAYLWRCGALET